MALRRVQSVRQAIPACDAAFRQHATPIEHDRSQAATLRVKTSTLAAFKAQDQGTRRGWTLRRKATHGACISRGAPAYFTRSRSPGFHRRSIAAASGP